MNFLIFRYFSRIFLNLCKNKNMVFISHTNMGADGESVDMWQRVYTSRGGVSRNYLLCDKKIHSWMFQEN